MWKVLAALVMGWTVMATAQGKSVDGEAKGEVLKGEYSVGRAMDLLYGNYDAAIKESTWSPKVSPRAVFGWPYLVRVRVLADETYVDGNVPRHMLVTWAKPDESGALEYSCHACGVLVGVNVFRKETNGWRVDASELQLAQIGVWGKPPKTKAQRLGPHAWGLVASVADLHQGQSDQALWIFGEQDGVFRQWFNAELVDDDKYGEFPQDDWCKVRTGEFDVLCVWREIDFAMHPAEGQPVYDLVKTRRTPTGGKQETWRFDGNGFVKAGKQAGSKPNR